MDQQDLFYWAYEHYKKEFENNRDDYLFKKGVNSRKAPNDFLSMVEIECEIDDDWIEAIEKGLEYIQKAIKEDRQFIRNEGEVLPIEKIRRVDKDSIVDLSKHSNYITKLPEEGETVIPEKLMMSKRENDYTIYENRVVYTTLSYLKDFVAERLEKIKDAVNKYDGTAEIVKTVELGYRTVELSFKIHDVRKNDPIAMMKVNAQDKIKRLDTILNGILVLLKTPLMQEVSKAPMVTRPVTKTNVLKMNTNFKETLYLFDYVCAYSKPGFDIKETVKEIKPLSIEQENTFTDVVLLYSFLAYEYNNHLEEQLKVNYLEEEKRREKIKDDELLARIAEMFNKAKRSEKTIAEYALMLEEGYKVLEKRLEEAKAEIQKVIDEYEQKIVEINAAHEEEINNLNAAHEEEINSLNSAHAEEISNLNEAHNEEVARLIEENKQAINEIEVSLQEKYSKEKAELVEQYESNLNSQSEEIINLNEENKKVTVEANELKNSYEERISDLENEIELVYAENLALKAGKKQIDPRDYISKERIDELEDALNTLNDFFERSWKYAKKDIKKRCFAKIKERPIKGEK